MLLNLCVINRKIAYCMNCFRDTYLLMRSHLNIRLFLSTKLKILVCTADNIIRWKFPISSQHLKENYLIHYGTSTGLIP